MVKGSATPSDGSPATAGGSPLAGSDPADQRLIDMTMEVGRTVQFDEDGQDQESENGDASEGEYEEKAETAELGETKIPPSYLARGPSALIPKATRNADTPSANKVLARLGEEMRARSEWMMMLAPVAMAQAKWPMLGPELTQPVRAANINQLVEETVLLLKAMGYRCNSRPNSLILSNWSLTRGGAERWQWKKKLRVAFGLEKAPGGTKKVYSRVAEFKPLGEDPSKIPLPKTPETKRREVFRATQGAPYFEDSHMLTPMKLNPTQRAPSRGQRNVSRYRELYDAADEAEAYEEDEEDDLIFQTHASLDKIAEFEGKRYGSDASLQWLKRFIYEMKSTRMPQSAWCEPFTLCLGRAAKSWYRQLPKKTQRRWKLLSEAFLDYYCSQFDQSARTRYYSARRKVNEPICDFLIQLNGYARTAKIQYEKGGADAADHVKHFLLHCGDDDVMDLMYPLQLEDISKVEHIINRRNFGEKRKKQRDRLVIARGREDKRKDQSHRDERRDGRRDEKRSRKEENRDRRVTVVDADSDGEELIDQNPPSPYNSEDEYGDEDQSGGHDSAEDDDYIDAGVSNDKGNTPAGDQNGSNRSWGNSANRPP
ncbi:hypothetical protein PInf_009425 [Phytophthora infestans]|nr:hypothetical protein PInf_009425 [Phytophthora infestans]